MVRPELSTTEGCMGRLEDGRASPVSSVGSASAVFVSGAKLTTEDGGSTVTEGGCGSGTGDAPSGQRASSRPSASTARLLAAVQGGSLEDVRDCIEAGADLDVIHKARGQTLVFFAAARSASREADAHGGLLGRGGRRGLLELLIEENGLKADKLDKMQQTPLFYAAREGDISACQYLIQQKCEPDHIDELQQSPLFYASSRGHKECVDMLLSHRCFADRVDKYKQTPLFYAASPPCIESLLRWRCDVNRRDNEGQTPVFFAVQRGAVDRTRLLVKHKADVQLANYKDWTCLFLAAKHGLAEMCRLLTDELGVDPYHCDPSGTTARHVAEANRHLSTAAVLQDAERKLAAKRDAAGSCQPGAEQKAGQKLGARLYIAVQSGTLEETKSLLEAKAQPSSVVVSGGENLGFHAAARDSGALEMLRLLVERKLDPTVVNTRLHQTPLFFAVRAGPRAGGEECAKFLMMLQCQPNHSDLRGETPLFYAVQRQDPGCAEMLMEAGAKACHTNKFGATAVFYAARAGATETMQALLANKAPADACDLRGQTALWEATSAGCTQLLLQKSCDPHHRSKLGQTAFMAASERGADDAIRAMLAGTGGSSSSRQSLVQESDSNGRTCLFYAASGGHAQTCQLLLDGRADPMHADLRSTLAVEVARNSGSIDAATVLRDADRQVTPGANKRERPADAAPDGAKERSHAAVVNLCSPGSDVSPLANKTARRRYSLTFTDQFGRALQPGTQEYSAALQQLVGACPWLDGWER